MEGCWGSLCQEPLCRGLLCWGPLCWGPLCWGPLYRWVLHQALPNWGPGPLRGISLRTATLTDATLSVIPLRDSPFPLRAIPLRDVPFPLRVIPLRDAPLRAAPLMPPHWCLPIAAQHAVPAPLSLTVAHLSLLNRAGPYDSKRDVLDLTFHS